MSIVISTLFLTLIIPIVFVGKYSSSPLNLALIS